RGSDFYGIYDGRIEWQLRERTRLFATVYRREEVSAVYAGQNFTLTGASAGIRQRLGKCWTATLEAGVENSRYQSVVSSSAQAGRRDEVVFVRPALEYQLSEDFRIGAGYRYERNASNQPGFGYDQHQL